MKACFWFGPSYYKDQPGNVLTLAAANTLYLRMKKTSFIWVAATHLPYCLQKMP